MADNKFLTAEEVSERYRGEITVGTLRNWRTMRIGPAFVKIGKAVLYPIQELDAWDQKESGSLSRQSRRILTSVREHDYPDRSRTIASNSRPRSLR
jgi:hypothetical protein